MVTPLPPPKKQEMKIISLEETKNMNCPFLRGIWPLSTA